MINVDLEIKKEFVRINYARKAMLKNSIGMLSKTYFKYMYSDPAISDLAKNVIDELKLKLKEIENELGSRKNTTDPDVLIRYP